MIRICYDYQIFGAQVVGGISRYFVELINHLPAECQALNTTLLTDNLYLLDVAGKVNRKRRRLPACQFKGKERIKLLLNKLYAKRVLKKKTFDIFHPTYYDPYFLPYLSGKPLVVTVYDMIHEKFPGFVGQDATVANKAQLLKNADSIIAISQNTKQDIIDLYQIDENKIKVIYLYHSLDIRYSRPVNLLPEKYILFVGGRGGYKNFDSFFDAFVLLNKRYPDMELVCTGTPFSIAELKKIEEAGLSAKCHACFVTDPELAYLYKQASAFVFPSIYEGFGIPILESFACGCPIALSNTSCFPEIAGDAGVYFDPYQVDSIANSLCLLIENHKLREEKIKLGYKIIKTFSWEKTALETYNVYKSLMK